MFDVVTLKRLFSEKHGGDVENLKYFFAPGRVNLIGEHIDYNGGYVFPAALSLGIYGVVRYRDDKRVNIKSVNAFDVSPIDMDRNIKYTRRDSWGNYPKGVIKFLIREGYDLKGCDILYISNLPSSAGLSSSAAMEILTGYIMLYRLEGDNIDKIYLAKLCQRAENKFIGVNCGIMDQFSVAMGKTNNAILLNCSNLKYKYVPIQLGKFTLVIVNTNKKRGLADSKYNERRRECENALKILKRHRKLYNLCQASMDDVNKFIREDTLMRRARHVITENERVMKSVEVLEKGDIEEFGRLMNLSHISLREDYEVTGMELDTLNELCTAYQGCIGARMTGAGFGGCLIALVDSHKIDDFKEYISREYYNKTGIQPDFYISDIWDGVSRIN